MKKANFHYSSIEALINHLETVSTKYYNEALAGDTETVEALGAQSGVLSVFVEKLAALQMFGAYIQNDKEGIYIFLASVVNRANELAKMADYNADMDEYINKVSAIVESSTNKPQQESEPEQEEKAEDENGGTPAKDTRTRREILTEIYTKAAKKAGLIKGYINALGGLCSCWLICALCALTLALIPFASWFIVQAFAELPRELTGGEWFACVGSLGLLFAGVPVCVFIARESSRDNTWSYWKNYYNI